MYIQCVKDSRAHCVDLSSGVVIQTLGSNTNTTTDHKHRTQLAISKCGTIVFTAVQHEITHWNHFHETKIAETCLLASEFDTPELDEGAFISSLAIHPRLNSVMACAIYGHRNTISMVMLNNQPSKLPQTHNAGDDHAIENVEESEREAVDRWRQIRQEIFAEDEHIGSFDDILERIDDLFDMAIKSPNRTDDYKKNILRKKKENVKKLLTDRSLMPTAAETQVQHDDVADNVKTLYSSDSTFNERLNDTGDSEMENKQSSHSNNTFVVNEANENATVCAAHHDMTELSTESSARTSGTFSIETNEVSNAREDKKYSMRANNRLDSAERPI